MLSRIVERVGLARRDVLMAMLVVTILLASVLGLVVGHSTLFLRDVANFHWPAKLEQARAWQQGVLPFVDLWRAGGQPGMGNLNGLPLYPSNALLGVMPTLEAKLWSFNAHFWLHLLLAPLALWLLARELGLRRGGAWMAASLFVASGFALSLLSFYNLVAGLVWMPLFLCSALRLSSEAGRVGALVACTFSWSMLLLAGDPTTAALGCVAVTCALFVRHGVRGLRTAAGRAGLGRLSLAVVCGLLLTWPQLNALRLTLDESVRSVLGYSAAGVLRGSVPPIMALDGVLPFLLGAPNTLFWAERLHGGAQPLFYSLSFGAVGVVLLLVALIHVRREMPAVQRIGLAWVVLGVFFASGGFNPLLELVASWGLLGWLRFPVKAWWLVVLGVSLLGGLVVDRLAGGESAPDDARASKTDWAGALRKVTASLALLYAGVLVAIAAGRFVPLYERLIGGELAQQAAAEALPRIVLAAVVGLLMCVALGVVASSGARYRPAWSALILLHVVSQLVLLEPLTPSMPTSEFLAPSPILAGLEAGDTVVHGSVGAGFGATSSHLALGRVELRDVQQAAQRAGYPSAGVGAGLRYQLNPSPEGLDSFRPGLFGQVLRQLDDASRLRLLQATGATRLISERPVEGPGALLELSDGARAFRYRLLGARPLLAATRWVHAATPQEAFEAILDPDFDVTTTVAVDGLGSGAGGLLAPRAPVEAGGGELAASGEPTVELVAATRHRLEVTVASDVPVVLATDRAFLPLLEARVNGVAQPVLVANVLRAAVALPAGQNTVVLEVDRSSWRGSLMVSVSGLLLLLALVARERRRS